MNNNKKNSIDNLIKKNYLPVIGNYLFMSRKIINKFKVKKVGLFGKFKGKSKYNIRNVLVSLGTAKMGSVQLKKIKTQATNMVKRLKYTRINLYLDPIFNLKNDYKNKCKIFKANYSSRMYKKIDLAVIKPGLGTVNDCLEYAIPMICYTRNFNEEFNYNAQILKKKKLCFIINDLENVPKLIFKIIKNKKYYKDHYLSCKKLKWGGENQIQKEIELNFNEKIFC